MSEEIIRQDSKVVVYVTDDTCFPVPTYVVTDDMETGPARLTLDFSEGVTVEHLLAICEHRLRGLIMDREQRDDHTDYAWRKVREALETLDARAAERKDKAMSDLIAADSELI